jgi:RNA polymerase sigma-70 factor (ECF subfamily)
MIDNAITDRELVARIQAGDRAACAVCIDKHSPGVYRLALRLMQHEADAEDVVQETFLSAFKGIGDFQGRSELSTWLYRIAYNTAMMRLRKHQPETVSVEETETADDGSLVPTQLFDWCCLPESDFETNETRAHLEQAIRDLPEKLRVVFVLRELEGLSTDETATALDISIETVKTRLHRARLWLRERLSTHFTELARSREGR